MAELRGWGDKPCPEPLRGCKYDPPFGDDHHLWWPKRCYTTALERAFRNHPDNVQRGICKCRHDLEHLKKPPKKPSREFMRRFLERHP